MAVIAMMQNSQQVPDSFLNLALDNLTELEAAYFSGLRSLRRKRRYVLSRALLAALRQAMGIVERDNALHHSQWHSQRRSQRQSQRQNSVSYTDSLVAVALNQDGAVGLDVESMVARDYARLLRAILPREQFGSLESLSPQALQQCFYSEWCARESLVKIGAAGSVADLLGKSLPTLEGWRHVQVQIDGFFVDARWIGERLSLLQAFFKSDGIHLDTSPVTLHPTSERSSQVLCFARNCTDLP